MRLSLLDRKHPVPVVFRNLGEVLPERVSVASHPEHKLLIPNTRVRNSLAPQSRADRREAHSAGRLWKSESRHTYGTKLFDRGQHPQVLENNGGQCRARTCDLLLVRQAL